MPPATTTDTPDTPDTTDTTPPAPQSSALPPTHPFNTSPANATTPADHNAQLPILSNKVKPTRKPLLRLELRDLSSDGTHAFLRLNHASIALENAVNTVLQYLYSGLPQTSIPSTRSVTLILREMDGVAYTIGLDLDQDHKEIHFNTSYIAQVDASRQKEEIVGVLIHEMVHCWQYNGQGAAPGGLIEGVADWVRLKAGYAPPHWKRRGDVEWDAGYEKTGYFLEWLEKECGEDVVRRINEALRVDKYDEDKFWNGCCGKSVEELWKAYKKSLEKSEE